jgi:gluconokinase
MTRPAEVIVGLDLGTTAVKAVAFGVDAVWRHMEEREYPLLSPAPGWQVQDTETIMAAVLDALAACVRGVGGAAVAAISVSTAMHGLIGLGDRRQPLTPLVTWADGRSAEEARELHARGIAGALHRETGTPVHSQSPLTKIIWFARNEPELASKVRWWVGLKDFALMRLTGQLVAELSSASATGMLSMATRHWSPAALEACGVVEDRLPEVVPTTAVLALKDDVASSVGMPSGTPVVAGAADGPLGNLGTGAMERGEVGISLGTSGAARMAVAEPWVDDRGALFCYALTHDCWVVGGAISNGGAVVRWAGEALAPDLAAGGDEAVLELAATAPPGSDGLVMLPYLLPERAPLWDPTLPGACLGLRSFHTRAHLVRAAVEGVCLQLSSVVKVLDGFVPVTSLRVTGGAFRAPLWREVMAAVMNRPLHVVASSGGTALGAAALGLYALGRTADLSAGVVLLDPASQSTEPVQPDPEFVEVYARLAASLPDLIEALQKIAAIHLNRA